MQPDTYTSFARHADPVAETDIAEHQEMLHTLCRAHVYGALTLLVVFTLTGCGSVMSDGAGSEAAAAASALPEQYCYRSLADVTCYNTPQPGERRRMVGYDGPPLPPE